MHIHAQAPSALSVPAGPLPPRVWAALAGGSDWVGSWWPPFILGACLAVTLLVMVLRRLRRRRAWPLALPALVFLLVCGLSVANTISGFVPSVAAAQVLVDGVKERVSLRRGAVTDLRIPVQPQWHLDVTDTYVYLPPGYERNLKKRYPVVYLIHGTPGVSSDWLAGGSIELTLNTLIRGGYIKPMIVVMPDMRSQQNLDTECLDSTVPGGGQVSSYLNGVVSYVDSHYRTKARYQDRAIGGFSMGGYCALDRGLRTTEFGVILSINPYDNPGAGGDAVLSTRAQRIAASPRHYVPTMTFQHPIPTFIAIGSQASAENISTAVRMARLLRSRNQPVELKVLDGYGHTWDMARIAGVYALRFASQHMS